MEMQKKCHVVQKSTVRGCFLCFPLISQQLLWMCYLVVAGSAPDCGPALRFLPAGDIQDTQSPVRMSIYS